VHIEGDLVETPTGGLALTVRGNGVPASTFEGSATDRAEEAIAIFRTAFGRASAEDRPYLLNVWANSINNTGGSLEEALGLYRAAASASLAG
jgi:hypothetical protein